MNGKNEFLHKLKEKSSVERAYNLGKPSAFKMTLNIYILDTLENMLMANNLNIGMVLKKNF